MCIRDSSEPTISQNNTEYLGLPKSEHKKEDEKKGRKLQLVQRDQDLI